MKKRISILLAFLLVFALVAGCAKDTSSDTPPAADATPDVVDKSTQAVSADTSIADAAAQSDTSAAAADKSTLPVAKKSISLAFSENCITLDPHDSPNSGSGIIRTMGYEALLIDAHDGNYYPWLATDWEHNEDGTEWTFFLREGVTFNNGEVFNADDVVCSYQRFLDEYEVLNNPVALYPDHLLSSVEKIDDYTVKITLSRTYATAIRSFAETFIIPNEAYEAEGAQMFAQQHCYATGPWTLVEWIDGQYAQFKKNETYWNKANFDSYYDEVFIRCVLEPSSSVAAHISGDVVGNIVVGGIDPDMLSLYAGTESKTQIISYYVYSYYYMGFNCAEGRPFYDINVRKAFEYAIDRQAICDAIMGGGVAISSIIPEGVVGYDPDLANYEYSPEKAKEYLEKSGYNGSVIKLSSNTSTTKAEDQLLAMEGYLEEVGFNIEVEIVENATLLEMRTSGNYDAFLVITMHGAGDAGGIMYQRVTYDYHKSGYVNDELNALIVKGQETIDATERGELYKQAARIMRDESAPHYALYAPNATQAIDYGIVGLELWADGNHCFRFTDFDPDATAWRSCDWAKLTTF